MCLYSQNILRSALLAAAFYTASAVACPVERATYRYMLPEAKGTARFEMLDPPADRGNRPVTLHVRFEGDKAHELSRHNVWLLFTESRTGSAKVLRNTIPDKPSWQEVYGRDFRPVANSPIEYFAWNEDHVPIGILPTERSPAPTYIFIPHLENELWKDNGRRIGWSVFRLDHCNEK